MEKNGLKLVVDRKAKPARRYAGEPIKCEACDNPNLIETFRPTYKDGRTVKGKRSGWACPLCQKVVWRE